MLNFLEKDPLIRDLPLELANPDSNIQLARGDWSGAGPLLAFLQAKLSRPMLFIGSSEERVRSLVGDSSLFTDKVRFLPPRETSSIRDPLLEGERTAVLRDLLKNRESVVFSTLASFLQPVGSPGDLKKNTIRLRTNESFGFESFLNILENFKYHRVPTVIVPNEYALRGGIIDVFSPAAPSPYRIEWLGDTVDGIRAFDPATQRSIKKIEELELFPPEEAAKAEGLAVDYFPPETLVVVEELSAWRNHDPKPYPPERLSALCDWIKNHGFLDLTASPSGRARPWPFQPSRNFTYRFRNFLEMAREELKQEQNILIYTRQASRMRDVLSESGLAGVTVHPQPLSRGFSLPSLKLQVYTDHELFGRVIGFQPARRSLPSAPVALEELKEGEAVVHARHGVALFNGITPLSVEGKREDYLSLSFAGKDKLYVPLEDMVLVERYIGPPGRMPPLSKFGSSEWRNTRRRAREAAKEMAQDLIRLYASRSRLPGHAFSPDTPWQAELEEAFPFIETPDQAKAIEETKQDMESPKPMDRLVLGDVGYGKTEVALRAAFKAVMDGKQAAVLVPTTILAQQHFETFTERLATFPVRVKVLSRFKKRKEIESLLSALADGEVDIVIGTHRLLQKDVVFKNIGLLIIDEEQRFGVTHKEALKKLRENIDVLTLSATPIPRTLQFSLAGVRDMSVIETSPQDRLPVKTTVMPRDEKVIRQAIHQELRREGQVYYLYNRIADIEQKAGQIRRLAPGARLAVAHGRMRSSQLEEIMWEFLKGLYDILLCTTIIENGLDIPRVNTLIVEQSERYGLADLYQLRGRVGRSDRQAYAYFFTSPRNEVTGLALKRLQAIEEFVQLGSGYQIALKDLEFRGAGNLLGLSQHGHMAHVGFHLYCRLVAEEVKKLKGEKIPVEPPNVTLDIPLPAYIPDEYIGDRSQKLVLYRKLASSKTSEQVGRILEELKDRFGPPPEETLTLLDMVNLKITCLQKGISKIEMNEEGARIRFSNRREDLTFDTGGGLPVKVRFDLLQAKIAVIEKSLGGSDEQDASRS